MIFQKVLHILAQNPIHAADEISLSTREDRGSYGFMLSLSWISIESIMTILLFK